MRVKIDPDICTGCELCVTTCPEVYKMEGDKSIVIANTVPRDAEASCRKAVEECPVEAIIIVEE
ncbi:MAG: ferredoxin [Planctomycetes bacterium RIFCSPHIGHO2_12_FULL_52_36]|jgi:ferredoxin|nr:MAG: ferredoxin [Planctomycetes bacterium RIFCSPHIGHO2_02_FULL_52_58]OHB93024.1 MAG: ferredoxin [Planctomycetes bacterium RIFCSPHIGHO2_12_FULL_52_36]